MILNEWYKGESKSRLEQTAPDVLDAVDIHYEPGFIRSSLALEEETTTVNEPAIGVTVPSGDVFWFSTTTGKIWKRAYATGVYSLVYTNTYGACQGAVFFSNYIWFISTNASITYIGRILATTASSESTWTSVVQNWDFLLGDAVTGYVPMVELIDYLYIGGEHYIARISSSTYVYNDSALDIYPGMIVTDLAVSDTYLIIAGEKNEAIGKTSVFAWDTIASSWTFEDEMPERTFNGFIPTDDMLFASAGTSGQLYYWNGKDMVKYYRLKSGTPTKNPYANTMFNGVALYGESTGKIISINQSMKDFPTVISGAYSTSSFYSMTSSFGTLYVSTGTSVVKTGTTYADGTITTPQIKKPANEIIIHYDVLPTDATISLESNVNGAGWVSETGLVHDPTNMTYVLANGITYDGTVNFIQYRITMNSSSHGSPVIREIEIN